MQVENLVGKENTNSGDEEGDMGKRKSQNGKV